MDYSRVTPRARQGTTGINTEADLTANNGAVLLPPDRLAAITVQVTVTTSPARYTIETTANLLEKVTANTAHWHKVYDNALTDDASVMIANAVTAIRVSCTQGAVNVAFCG